MKILMLGWEYPPKITGGLGVACHGIASSLAAFHQVDFLLPKRSKKEPKSAVKLIDASSLEPNLALWKAKTERTEELTFLEIGQNIVPYLPPDFFVKIRQEQKKMTEMVETESSRLLQEIQLTGTYHQHIMGEIKKYALLACQVAEKGNYDLVHAHDWVTAQAGIAVKNSAGIPLVLHLHSTEQDRNGGNGNPEVIAIERMAVKKADVVIAVSSTLKKSIILQYGIPAAKIKVAPNGMNSQPAMPKKPAAKELTVGFVGRFTDQKSPTRFVDIARELANVVPNVHFVMVGDGYLMESVRNKISQLNLSHQFTLKGFLSHEKTVGLIAGLDMLIVPSAAEPFGLVALEAVRQKIPVIMAKGAGIVEFVPSIPQVEHWDTFTYSHLATSILNKDQSVENQTNNCYKESVKLTWENTANYIQSIYESVPV